MNNIAQTNPAAQTQAGKHKIGSAQPPLALENEQMPPTLLGEEDPIHLGRETYTEPSTKKLLQFLLENENQHLTPTYSSQAGFVYEKVNQILGERIPYRKTTEILNRLARLDILQKSFFDSAAACPSCQSTTMTVHNRCPNCKSHHIINTSLTEHITCGYIGENEKYIQDRCPKCGSFLTETDHKNIGRWYTCRECSEKFEDPQVEYICRNCSKTFSIDEAKTIELSQYSLNPKRKIEIRQAVASIESTSNLVRELGFAVEMPGLAIGKQSGMQHHFSAIAKKQVGDTEFTITIDHAVGEPDVEASPLIIYIYKISEVKVDLPIFIAIPRLNEAAKKIAQGRNILIIEGIPTKETEISDIKKRIENQLYHLNEGSAQEEDNKGDIWKRPMLKRDEQKPAFIDIIPSIHPKEMSTEVKESSFVSHLKRTFVKERNEKNGESS